MESVNNIISYLIVCIELVGILIFYQNNFIAIGFFVFNLFKEKLLLIER